MGVEFSAVAVHDAVLGWSPDSYVALEAAFVDADLSRVSVIFQELLPEDFFRVRSRVHIEEPASVVVAVYPGNRPFVRWCDTIRIFFRKFCYSVASGLVAYHVDEILVRISF